MKRMLLMVALAGGLTLAAQEKVRQVRLTDFSEPFCRLTLGGEFPGAKGTLENTAENGVRFDRLAFDLTKGNYVGFNVEEMLPEGTTRVKFRLRVGGGAPAALFVRFRDATGQDHLHRIESRPGAAWSEVACDVKAAAGHWGGANDGVLHTPVKSLTLGLEVHGAGARTGTFDLADCIVTTTAGEATLPPYTLTCAPARFGGLYRPDEAAAFKTRSFQRDVGVSLGRSADVEVAVTDWNGARVCRKTVRAADLGALTVTPAELGGRFGAFKLTLTQGVGAGAVTAETWFARLTGPAPKPCFWVGTGTHGGHGWAYGDLRYLDILAEAGIGMVREDFCWEWCEVGKDGFKMPPTFRAYAEALHARGIALNCIFNGKSKVHENPYDPQAAAKWCAWAVKEFGDTVNDYELWNEPHNFGFRQHYQKDSKDNDGWMRKFVECSKACRDAIVAVRPGANVLLTAEDVEAFFTRMVEFGIARDNDVLSFHPYCHFQIRPEREMFFKDDGAAFRKLAVEHGGAHRFRITEAGWTTVMSTNMTHAFVGCYPRSTYHDQARYIVRMFLLTRALGIESAMQYDFRNDGSDRYYTENNFGLVHEDYSPKPALAAIAFMTRLIGHAQAQGAFSKDRGKYRVYGFKDGAREVLAAWSVEGDAEAELPAGWEGAACRDLQGNAIPVPVSEGRLRLTETPVYLVKGALGD